MHSTAAPPIDTERWLTDPVESGPAAGFGVYLHVPFCAHRCGYCDFAAYDDMAGWVQRYVTALRLDLERTAAARSDWPRVTSVFVGGGTPTQLAPGQLAGLVAAVGEAFELTDDAELTVEANPEDVTVELSAALVAAGVNRVSMGVQSFTSSVLATLERRHRPERVAEAVAAVRDGGIPAVNLDLIYGTPGETDDDWRRTLAAALALVPDHVSAYALTVHENTSFGRAVAAGRLPAPDDDVQADRFEAARAVLGDAGYEHYEVSNWCLGSSRRSRHNVLYWRHGDYLGLGVGAHGHRDGHRWWSHRSIPRYVTAIEQGESPHAGEERLSADERADERLLLGLRLREGLHPNDVPPLDPMALEDALAAGLVTTACGRLQATEHGWFLLDEAVRRLR